MQEIASLGRPLPDAQLASMQQAGAGASMSRGKRLVYIEGDRVLKKQLAPSAATRCGE
jgi:hypothetical protein